MICMGDFCATKEQNKRDNDYLPSLRAPESQLFCSERRMKSVDKGNHRSGKSKINQTYLNRL